MDSGAGPLLRPPAPLTLHIPIRPPGIAAASPVPCKAQENAFLGTAPPLPVSLEMLLRKTSPHHLVLGPEWEQTLNCTAGAGAELHPVRRAAR